MQCYYFFSDIHANLPAFMAVINDIGIEEFNTAKKYFLRDYVHFGPHSNEVIGLLRTLNNCSFIEGNHDIYCSKPNVLDYQNKYLKDIPELADHTDWIRSLMTYENLEWLQNLQSTIVFELNQKKFILFYGSFNDPEISVDINDERLTNYDYILCGHSHKAGIWKNGKSTLINVGSVGEPLDGDSHSSYVILEIIDGECCFEIKRVEYNTEGTIADIQLLNIPFGEQIIRSLKSGKVG